MNYLIKNANIINEGKIFKADLVIEGEYIKSIVTTGSINDENHEIIDAEGKYLIPGVIDDQVHFREPGLTHKGDCLLYTSPSPRDVEESRMPSSA